MREATAARERVRDRWADALDDALRGYRDLMRQAKTKAEYLYTMRSLAERDHFYFMYYVMNRQDAAQPFVFRMSREWQQENEGVLDLWAREHWKSSIATQTGIPWGLIHDPERTYGIFSFTRPIAKGFLRQIKQECETNPQLHELWPHIFWSNPKREAPKWSEDDGLFMQRKGNQKEASVEAWGLIDGQPTSKHFSDLHYEDVETEDTVRTPDMILKTTTALRNSFNLGRAGGRRRYYGTFWHYAGPYRTLIDEGIARPRLRPATHNGQRDGRPVLWTREHLAERVKDLGPYLADCHLFMDPKQSSMQVFRDQWMRYWKADRLTGLNLYILADPAHSKKKESDYTVFWVVGLGADRNYYAVNMIRDRLSLTQRANILFRWHQQYRPVGVGYERYGLQSDIEHFEDRMTRDNYRFSITELAGPLGKMERIGRLVPVFSQGRLWMPESMPYVQYDGGQLDLTKVFLNDEYKAHPFEKHDDMLDALSRILDDELGAVFPQGEEKDPMQVGGRADEQYDPLRWGLRR